MAGSRPGSRAVLSLSLLTGLWLHPNFRRLWAGQTVSLLGSSVTLLALPLTAVQVLGAGAFQMGLLGMAGRLPFLLVGLPAGVWVDRSRPRRILIATNLVQAAVLGSIPAAAIFGLLNISLLCAVAFLAGTMAVFFDIAYMTYLPALVERRHLIEGNSKLATSDSLTSVIGPSVGGWLVQMVTAPMAIIVDVLSFLLSSALLLRIRESVPRRTPSSESQDFRRELMEGFRALLSHRALRDCALAAAILNLFGSVQVAVYMLYLANDLNLDPATIGAIYAVFGVGSVTGAAFADRIGRRLGTGATLIGTTLVAGLVALLVPLAHWFPSQAVLLLMVSQGIFGVMILVFNVNMVTFRQTVTPERVLGRVTATTRSITWGVMPVGALLGGAFGEVFGLVPTLVICALGALLAPVWLLLSPVRGLRSASPLAEAGEARADLAGS